MAEERRFEGFNLLAGFVIGSLTIGLLVYLITKSIAAMRGPLSAGGGGQGQPINIYNVTGGQGPLSLPAPQQSVQPSQLTNQMQLANGTSLATKMDTVMLNPVRSSRVFSVPRKGPMWRIRLSVIGPAGGYGIFSVDSPLPDGPNTNLTIGAPQGVVVPAGGHTEVRLGPRQIIYGRAAGTEDDVQVSVTASAEIF